MKSALAWSVAALVAGTPVVAQHDQHLGGDHHSQYANQEPSGVSSLSRQELDDLLAGAGMGFARPAELNHYPGPKHVLELAAELELTAEQRTAVEAVRGAMLASARELGEKIVELERHLDRRFAHRHIDEASLRAATAEIAELYGQLRFAHLRAHLETRELLTDSQIADYDRLRGYSD